jgi:DNA ligase-1
MLLQEFQELVNQLQSTTGRIEKENILKRYLNNEGVKEILNFIFNPYRVTGISKKKFNKKVFSEPTQCLKDIKDVINYIILHNSGRDMDIANIQHFVSHNYEYKSLIEAIVTKELKLGVQPLTLNKIFGDNFIPLFNVMLAEKYFDNPEKYLPEGTEFTLTQKLDGIRCICIVENGEAQFFTRQGQVIEGLNEIKKEIEAIAITRVFDGELLLENKDNLPSKDLYRATVKEANKDGEKYNLIFNIFDTLSVEGFKSGYEGVHYSERRKALDELKYKLENTTLWDDDRYSNKWVDPKHLHILPALYQGKNQVRIQEFLDKITSEGGEGVMININNAPYECKRTRKLLKVKKMQTMDLRVVAMEEGEGVNKGSLGALKVEFPAPDGNVYIVDVGGGYTLEERKYFYNNPDKIIGKIIEVQYFEVSQNEKGGYALRFPVFLHVREDKDEPSTF